MREESAARLVDIALSCAGGALRSGVMEPVIEAFAKGVDAEGGGYYRPGAGGHLHLAARTGRCEEFREDLESSQWLDLLGHDTLEDFRIRCFQWCEFPWLPLYNALRDAHGMAVFFRSLQGGVHLVLFTRTSWPFGPDEQGFARQTARLFRHCFEGRTGPGVSLPPLAGDTEFLERPGFRSIQGQIEKRERLAVLAGMAAKLSHEIRNPLGAIRNSLYWLSRKSSEPEIARRISGMDREVGRCSDILQSLLSFCEGIKPARRPEDVNALVEATFKEIDIPDSIEGRVDLDPHVPVMQVDAALIKRALANLLMNAVESMPGGGRVTVRSRASDASIEISVEDTGTGIRPDQFDRLFDPLFTTKGKGLGLGLVWSLNIVQAHGGVIEAAARPGGGSRFTIRLSRPPEAAAPGGRAAGAGADGAPRDPSP